MRKHFVTASFRIAIFSYLNTIYLKYFLFFFLPFVCFAQNNRNYPPVITDAQEYVYKKASGIKLKLWVYPPSQQKTKTPVILFFFGGGFRNGSPEQFVAQARYFASRGISATVVDYRVFSRNQVQLIECLAEAKRRHSMGSNQCRNVGNQSESNYC